MARGEEKIRMKGNWDGNRVGVLAKVKDNVYQTRIGGKDIEV